MLVKHIKNLLAQYEKVVVPHLGTFTTSYAHAEVSTDNSTILPPYKRISFYEYEVDGGNLLRDYVIANEDIDIAKFEKSLKDFTNDIKTQIAIFGQYEVKGLGKFSKNENGVLQFQQLDEYNFLGDSFGLPNIEYQPLKQPVKEPVTTTVNSNKPEKELVSDDSTKDKNKSSELVWWLLVIPLLFVFVFLIYLFAQKDAMSRFKSFFNGADTPIAVTSEAKSYENFQKTKPEPVAENQENTSSATDVPEPEKEDKDLLINKNKVAKADNPTTEVATEGKFYIVLASFASTDKAEKMRSSIGSKGIDTKIITNKEGKQFRVVYNQEFVSTSEAAPKLKEVSEKLGTQLWVAKY
jgi:nucleoid DNA-binding protein/cell division septation protein DedD